MLIKNVMGVSEVRFKKLDFFTLEMSKETPNPQFSAQRAPKG